MKKIYEYLINGKAVAIHKDSIIRVQIGKNKSSYRDKYTFKGHEMPQAIIYYNGINIGNGYKKRLYVDSFNKPVLDRQFS